MKKEKDEVDVQQADASDPNALPDAAGGTGGGGTQAPDESAPEAPAEPAVV